MPPKRRIVNGERKALVIAIDEYEQEALRNLLAPAADAEALRRVLGDAQIGDFAVQVVQNQPSHVIEEQIEDLFAESRPDDLLLLHFSGHGLKSDSGELFFAASNTRLSRLESTAVSADFVQRCMRDARSRQIVLLLDCCYGGAFSPGVKVRAAGGINLLDSFPPERSDAGRGRAVITASSAMEFAFEGDQPGDKQDRPSVFTSALVEGLATGEADRDGDGWISLDELYDYVYDKVRKQNPHQTPSRQVDLEGRLHLARNRRRRIRPAQLPVDLQAALADPNMYTRRGAVHELESLLTSEDLPVALGAYEALTELARTGVRYVAELAAPALNQAVIRPEETEVHFGDHWQGSDSPHRTVRLLGPPIARHCVPHPSDDWIHVSQTAEGLDISADTIGTGTLSGNIRLRGPTGEAVVAVDIALSAQAARNSRGRGRAREEGTAPAIRVDQPKRQAAAESHQATRQNLVQVTRPRATESRRHPIWTARKFAGLLAITGAVLAVAGLFPGYMFATITDSGRTVYHPVSYMTPGWDSFIVATAALYLAAGACTLIPRAAPLLGPGLMLGTAAASTSALVYNITEFWPGVFTTNVFSFSNSVGYGEGFWIQLASNVCLLLAACAAGLALARLSGVRFIQRPPRNLLTWVVVLVGAGGALALTFQDFQLAALIGPPWNTVEVSSIVITVCALVMPFWAALTAPARLRAALLASWIWVGAAFCLYFFLFSRSQFPGPDGIPIGIFGITLIVLAVVAVPFARSYG